VLYREWAALNQNQSYTITQSNPPTLGIAPDIWTCGQWRKYKRSEDNNLLPYGGRNLLVLILMYARNSLNEEIDVRTKKHPCRSVTVGEKPCLTTLK